MTDRSEERSRKRRRLSNNGEKSDSSVLHEPRTLTSTISPPPLRRVSRATVNTKVEEIEEDSAPAKINLFPERRMKSRDPESQSTKPLTGPDSKAVRVMNSPFQLTWIQDLPESSNKDAISLKDLLGDPLIAECWDFNYLHNLDFLMNAFDPDVRDIVKVHVIHGFWKNEDQSRLYLKEQAKKYPNLKLLTAYMPEMFGTHHTKMLVLIRHDDMAQIIIHTANMIPFDWTNMCQAVWKSPLLPKIGVGSPTPESSKIGSGSKFKIDFLNYLRAYDTKRTICKPLIDQLANYDFSSIRAALIASVPGKQGIETDSKTLWGWPGLQSVLKEVSVQGKEPEIVVQISSIATLGKTDKWLDKTLFTSLSVSKSGASKSRFKVIFPTADEIRRSLNGYASGSAIHTKIQSPAQAEQLRYLKPILYHWTGDGQAASSSGSVLDAGRRRAAPHIKTYIRFADSTQSSIDWMLVTSANLSKQAWGEAINSAGDIRICSYELGVIVWPELFGEKATMVPTFKSDTPVADATKGAELIIGARMPYDLPLVPYSRDDTPWCASASYSEPDWMGQTYRD